MLSGKIRARRSELWGKSAFKEIAERSCGKRPKRLGGQKSVSEVRRTWRAMESMTNGAERFLEVR